MPRSLILPAVVLGIALAAVAVSFVLDTGGPVSRDAALLIGTVALWLAAASAVWLLAAAVVLLLRSRRRPSRS